MTIAKSIHCPSCGQIIHLKFQIEPSISWREWPLVLECPDCYNVEEITYSSKGFKPSLRNAEVNQPGYKVAYCGTLPTPDMLYYEKAESGIGINSVFMMIHMLYPNVNLRELGMHMSILENGIVKYRQALPKLYHMLNGKRTNPKAYYNKMKIIFGNDIIDKPYTTIEECYEHYHEMQECVYRAISMGDYNSGNLNAFFYNGIKLLIDKGPDAIQEVIEKGLYTKIIDDKVSTRINECVSKLQILLPAFFLDFIPNYRLDEEHLLYILSGTFETINDMYASNFEVICQCIPILMSIFNMTRNGRADIFKNDNGVIVDGDMSKFVSLNNGNKISNMMKIAELNSVFSEILNTKIRNGYNHENTIFYPDTQIGEYHYDQSRPDVVYEIKLIDVAHAVIDQLRCLLLITKLFHLFKKIGNDK